MSGKTAKAKRKESKVGLTNGELFDAMSALKKLLDIDFHIKDSLRLRKLRGRMSEPFKVIAEIRDKLIEKYGVEEPQGSGIFTLIGPNNPDGKPMSKGYLKYIDELTELMNHEADIKFEMVKLPSVIDRRPISFSANDLERLEKFVEII